MSKPAGRFQKPKPDAMRLRAKLVRTSSTSSHARPASATHSATWTTSARNRGSRSSGTFGAPLSAPRLMAGSPYGSADRRGVLQAALGPQHVEAARDLERRALTDVALEDLAVVADMLDDAI